jgi:hypothetical protein
VDAAFKEINNVKLLPDFAWVRYCPGIRERHPCFALVLDKICPPRLGAPVMEIVR